MSRIEVTDIHEQTLHEMVERIVVDIDVVAGQTEKRFDVWLPRKMPAMAVTGIYRPDLLALTYFTPQNWALSHEQSRVYPHMFQGEAGQNFWHRVCTEFQALDGTIRQTYRFDVEGYEAEPGSRGLSIGHRRLYGDELTENADLWRRDADGVPEELATRRLHADAADRIAAFGLLATMLTVKYALDSPAPNELIQVTPQLTS